MIRIYRVELTRFAEKRLKRLPVEIREALLVWAETIELHGIQAMRKSPGYHDEALKGDRLGQRSSRLNRAYRVIYIERDAGEIVIVGVLEVNKHDY